MALKLFRSTGYSSIFGPGETRAAMHPGWLMLAVSLWAGFVCNVALWRALGSGAESGQLTVALALGAFTAAASGSLLCLLGWRRTLKPAATLVLFAAALSACAIWVQGLPLDASAAQTHLSTMLIPPWASFLRWRVLLLVAVLAVAPSVWVWNTKVQRLPGPSQLVINGAGMLVALGLLAVAGVLLFSGAL